MDKQNAISLVLWTLIILAGVLGVDLVIVLLLGFWQPTQILLAISGLAFFETGFFLFIAGVTLMIGGFPSLGKAVQKDWTPKKGKEARELSYLPLLVAGLLFLVSALTALAVYGPPI